MLEVELADETGTIVLCFLGRRAVAGMRPGASVVASGTAAVHHSRLVILNPAYRLGADSEGGGPVSASRARRAGSSTASTDRCGHHA